MLSLINYSKYSLGRSLLSVEDIVLNAKKNNIKTLALTDVNSLTAAPKFMQLCQQHGIHGLVGLTLKVTNQNKVIGDLVLLAKGQEGYQALKALEFEGLYDSIHLDPSVGVPLTKILSGEFAEHFKHCIVLDGFYGSLGHYLIEKYVEKPNSVENVKRSYSQIESPLYQFRHQFGQEDYIAVKTPNQRNALSMAMLSTGRVVISPVVKALTNEQLMLTKQWSLVTMNKWLKDNGISEDKLVKRIDANFYENTFQIEESNLSELLTDDFFIKRCQGVSITSEQPIIESLDMQHAKDQIKNSITNEAMFLQMVEQQWIPFIRKIPAKDQLAYESRKLKELNAIKAGGYIDYFMNVHNFKLLSKQSKIGTMLRGSGVSSLLLHVLGQTPIDPVKNGLLFERFISPERNEEPDVDIEFSHPELFKQTLNQVFNGQIAAIKDVVSVASAERLITIAVEAMMHYGHYTDEQLRNIKQSETKLLSFVKKKYKYSSAESFKDYQIKIKARNVPLNEVDRFILSGATQLDAGLMSYKTSPASVIIVPEKVQTRLNTLPSKVTGNLPEVRVDKENISPTGLVKYDLLSNNIFQRVYNTLNELGLNEYYNIPSDSFAIKAVFEADALMDITQLGQVTGRKLAQKLKPNTFQEISVMVSLTRESTGRDDDEAVNSFIQNKQNAGQLSQTMSPLLYPYLKETYGSMVYEEQLMQILTEVAGFSWSEADALRSGLKKSKPGIIQQNEQAFIDGVMKKHNLTIDDASKLYQPFRDKENHFVFSKAHSVAYSYLAVQQCFLKVYHPAHYFAEIYVGKQKDLLPTLLEEWTKLRQLTAQQTLPKESVFMFVKKMGDIIVRENNKPFSKYKKDTSLLFDKVKKAIKEGYFDRLLDQSPRAVLLAHVEQIEKLTELRLSKTYQELPTNKMNSALSSQINVTQLMQFIKKNNHLLPEKVTLNIETTQNEKGLYLFKVSGTDFHGDDVAFNITSPAPTKQENLNKEMLSVFECIATRDNRAIRTKAYTPMRFLYDMGVFGQPIPYQPELPQTTPWRDIFKKFDQYQQKATFPLLGIRKEPTVSEPAQKNTVTQPNANVVKTNGSKAPRNNGQKRNQMTQNPLQGGFNQQNNGSATKNYNVNWRSEVMIAHLLEFLWQSKDYLPQGVDLTFSMFGEADSRAYDRYKFEFNGVNGECHRFHLCGISTNPERYNKRNKKYALNTGFYQGDSGMNGTNTPSIMMDLYQKGLLGQPAQEHDNKKLWAQMFKAYNDLVKQSPAVLRDLRNENVDALNVYSVQSPVRSYNTVLNPYWQKRLNNEVFKHLTQGRGLDANLIKPYFESGKLMLATKYGDAPFTIKSGADKGQKKLIESGAIVANFQDITVGSSLCDPVPVTEQMLSLGGSQVVQYKMADPKKGIPKNTLTGTRDHGTNNLNNICFGMPQKESQFIWFSEGIFDMFAFNELQLKIQQYQQQYNVNIPHVEANCISVKAGGNGFRAITKALGVYPLENGDFALQNEQPNYKPINDEQKQAFHEFFVSNKIHWVNDGTQQSNIAEQQLITLMRLSGVSDEESVHCFFRHAVDSPAKTSFLLNQLSKSVLLDDDAVLLTSGNLTHWLKNNEINITFNSEQQQYVVKHREPDQAISKPFSQMTPQEQQSIKVLLQNRFNQAFGAKGLGLAMDNDPAGVNDAIKMQQFCDKIGLPVRQLMPEIIKKHQLTNGQMVPLKDPNDYLKAIKIYENNGEVDQAIHLLKQYMRYEKPADLANKPESPTSPSSKNNNGNEARMRQKRT